MSSQRGFTLIEMAFVIVIVSLLVGGGLMSIGPIIEKTRITQTNGNFDQIENALTVFVIRNNRLPCPADGSQNNSSVSYGVEVTQLVAGTCNLTATNSVIPWKTLGLDEAFSIDGWGNRISYFPASGQIAGVNNLVDSSSGVARACPADATGATCTLCLSRTTAAAGSSTRATSCDIATAGLTPSYPYGNYIAIYAISNNACSTELSPPNTNQAAGAFNGGADTCAGVTAPAAVTASNVAYDGGRAAYVLISHGRTGWYGWNKAGVQVAPPGSSFVFKKYNSNGSAGTANNLGFVQGSPMLVNGSVNYFDDILRWRSPSYLIQSCGSSSCGNP
ncbi:MAG TPA: type II secretion system protein [Rhodospirillaceae bacterium]|nr:type II secretion system protein [Rhodospirillaceae bacterium]